MSRHRFGGGLADWAFQRVDEVDGNDDMVQLVGGATLTFWNLASGGTQYTDLIVDGQPGEEVVTSDGSDGLEVGTIPAFQGPEGVWWMWADGGNGRYVITAWDIGDFVADAIQQAAANSSAIQSHVGTVNPHATRVRDLDDVSTTAAAQVSDGQVLGYSTSQGLWLPVNIEGVSGVVTLATEQTITARKIFQNEQGHQSIADASIELPALPNQEADLLLARNHLGQRTGYLNEHGEFRVIASTPATIPLRVKQRNNTQTANLTEWTTIDFPGVGEILARVDAQGRVRGRNVMMAPWLLSLPGTLTVGPGASRIYNDTGAGLAIRSIRASAGVAPTGSSVIVDVKKGGTTIFGDPGDRPTIAAGTHTSGRVDNAAIAVINDGEYLTVDIDQIGSSVAGADLVVQIAVW